MTSPQYLISKSLLFIVTIFTVASGLPTIKAEDKSIFKSPETTNSQNHLDKSAMRQALRDYITRMGSSDESDSTVDIPINAPSTQGVARNSNLFSQYKLLRRKRWNADMIARSLMDYSARRRMRNRPNSRQPATRDKDLLAGYDPFGGGVWGRKKRSADNLDFDFEYEYDS